MRLYELQEPPPIKTTIQTYMDKGYTRTGAPSASASVFASPDRSSVVKVGKTSDCWLNFAEKARNSTNPHIPKIISLDTYGAYYLAVIEHLSEVPQSFFRNKTYQRIAAWMYFKGKWKNGKDVYLNDYTIDEMKSLARQLIKLEPDIVQALQLVIDAKGECNFDCHPDNFMKRKNGTLVITDPLTHQG